MKKFIVANPFKASSDWHALTFQQLGLLEKYLVGRRRLPKGIDPGLAEKLSWYYLPEYFTQKTTHSDYLQETVRFASAPYFDRWVQRRLVEKTNILAGLGYINKSLEWIKTHGGDVYLEARNSHPECFWDIVSEEYELWGFRKPPIPPFHNQRQRKSVELADYIFSPSDFVTNSFVEKGFPADRILKLPYPVNTDLFTPPADNSAQDEFVIMSSGGMSLRKGTPYLLQAFEQFRKEVPTARLQLLDAVAGNMKGLMASRFSRMDGVEWFRLLPHEQLVQLLQESSVFVMPSIEEGMVRSAIEAMATGLPVIVTPNTGVNDYVVEKVNGSIVPIRDVDAIVDSFRYWHRNWIEDRTAYKQRVYDNSPDLGHGAFHSRLSMLLESIAA